MSDDYSSRAVDQLDAMEAGDDMHLYNAVLVMVGVIFDNPSLARAMSTTVRTDVGLRRMLPVPGRHPYKVFWSTDGPRVEAVFPYSR